MTETPFFIFVLIYTAVIIIGAYYGLEVTARLSVVGFLLVVLLDFLMIIGSVLHFKFSRLLPLFDVGVGPVVTASTGAGPDVAMAVMAALMLLPLTQQPKKWLRISWQALAAGAVLVTIWTVFEIGVMGAQVTSQYLIACMQMSRAAELSIYLHRYELIMVALFVYSVITQSIICLYSATEIVRESLPFGWGRKVGRLPMLIVLGALMAVVQYFLGSDRDVYGQFLGGLWPALVLPIAYGLPLLIAVVALFRTRGRGPAAQQAEPG